MANSKIVYNGETLIDLTADTVTPNSLIQGYTAHGADGEEVVGEVVVPTKMSELENDVNLSYGFTGSSDAWDSFDRSNLPDGATVIISNRN